MIWQIELIILIIVVILALGALAVKDLLGAAILFGASGNKSLVSSPLSSFGNASQGTAM